MYSFQGALFWCLNFGQNVRLVLWVITVFARLHLRPFQQTTTAHSLKWREKNCFQNSTDSQVPTFGKIPPPLNFASTPSWRERGERTWEILNTRGSVSHAENSGSANWHRKRTATQWPQTPSFPHNIGPGHNLITTLVGSMLWCKTHDALNNDIYTSTRSCFDSTGRCCVC